MRVVVSHLCGPGQFYVMVDFAKYPFASDEPLPEERIVVCHPDDERLVRDGLALAEEFFE